jgi:hypothetical protein
VNIQLTICSELFKRLPRPKFGKWIALENKKEQVIKAVESGSPDFPKSLASYISTALHIKSEAVLKSYWFDTVSLFTLVASKTAPRIPLPLILQSNKGKPQKPDDWDYEGRQTYLYTHLFAQKYGWNQKLIGNLDVDTALALLQEILTSDQLDREFQWGMTEIAYPYDAQTKQSRFSPLPRPQWMYPKSSAPKKTKLLRSQLPIGSVEIGRAHV